MLAELDCAFAHYVLEVGAGSGYAAALLAQLVRRVDAVERLPELAASARQTLGRLGIDNVTVYVGDGTTLFTGKRYHRVLVSAGASSIPLGLLELLPPGGKLVMPVGDADLQTLITCQRSESGALHYRAGTQCVFVPLVSS